jgi:putative flavoprotein involved in K+ transport
MPRSYGRYPGRDDFVAYLERYVAHHRLRVRFNTTLVRVERASDLWRLETSVHPTFCPLRCDRHRLGRCGRGAGLAEEGVLRS